MLERARTVWFRQSDTIAFDQQFSQLPVTKNTTSNSSQASRQYSIPERAEIVKWIRQWTTISTRKEAVESRIKGIKLMAALCKRQETRRRERERSLDSEDYPHVSESYQKSTRSGR
jgi:hypothetical protein